MIVFYTISLIVIFLIATSFYMAFDSVYGEQSGGGGRQELVRYMIVSKLSKLCFYMYVIHFNQYKHNWLFLYEYILLIILLHFSKSNLKDFSKNVYEHTLIDILLFSYIRYCIENDKPIILRNIVAIIFLPLKYLI